MMARRTTELGLLVQAYTMSVESLDLAIKAGVDIVTHGEFTVLARTISKKEMIRKLVKRGIAVFLLPFTQR